MSESIVIYAGSGKAGRIRKQAIERESRRRGRKISVSEMLWELIKVGAPPELKLELEQADSME